MFARQEYDVVNISTQRRVVKDFESIDEAVTYVSNLNRYNCGKYELYDQTGKRIFRKVR